ncbi:hypothetical protein ACWDRR_16260 [Kitasatospora sp. NPDC003701]
MAVYDIAALLARFDTFTADQGALTGRLSSLVGEELLLDVLAHALAPAGPVELLDERPRRDGEAFAVPALPALPVPGVRDLDAWLRLGDGGLVAVECKHWTASSRDGRTSLPQDPDELAVLARRRWRELADPARWQDWDQVTKIALPLRPPAGATAQDVRRARRVLAVWRPVSCDGVSPFSRLGSSTPSEGQWADVVIEVFSASLYLRRLQAAGTTGLVSAFPRVDELLGAVQALFRPGAGDV